MSLAEVGIVYGTAPWVWITMLPGAEAGTVPGRVSLVPLRDLLTILASGPLTATTQVRRQPAGVRGAGVLRPAAVRGGYRPSWTSPGGHRGAGKALRAVGATRDRQPEQRERAHAMIDDPIAELASLSGLEAGGVPGDRPAVGQPLPAPPPVPPSSRRVISQDQHVFGFATVPTAATQRP
jgi:hypothetical protein